MWLPIFLGIAAMIVNLGTAQTWRMRGDFAARNAAWEMRRSRDDGWHSRIPTAWGTSVTVGVERLNSPAPLDSASMQEPAVRGPYELRVNPVLEPGPLPLIVGHGQVTRRLPMISSARPFSSADIPHLLIDDTTWSTREIGRLPNNTRRTLRLYGIDWSEMPP
jgi:hypothetical protein